MRFPPEFLDDIRRRVGLVDIVARKVKLTRHGREHTGLCPFHSEKTPSFTVNEDKGFYHCFGCGAHGDAFRFLTESEGLHFVEAVERLASEAGLEMPQLTAEEKENYEKRASLYDVMQAASDWFQLQLGRQVGIDARRYLQGRGLEQATIEHFKLGFAPADKTGLKDALLARGMSEEQLDLAGLIIKPEDGRPSIDRFRNRIIFPIIDVRDRIIAFGGRAMEADAKAKYLNSPETPLFHKGHNLYNIGPARKVAYDTGSIIVCEGYMDVIALHQAGFENAVAPLGTAVTEDQIGLLWRLAAEPILCFDGDNAGMRAAERALERALPRLKPGLSLQIALLPEGEDPDSLVNKEGAAAFQRVLNEGVGLAEMLWRILTRGADVSTPERQAGLEKKVFAATRPIEDENIRKFYNREFSDRLKQLFWDYRTSRRTGSSASGLNRQNTRVSGALGKRRSMGSAKFSGAQRTFAGASNELKRTKLARADGDGIVSRQFEELIILAILNHPALLVPHVDRFLAIEFESQDLKLLRDVIVEYAECDRPLEIDALKNHLIDEGLETVVQTLLTSDSHKSVFSVWPKADISDAEVGWLHTINRFNFVRTLEMEKAAAEQALSQNFTNEGVERVRALQEQLSQAAGNEIELSGYGIASNHKNTY